MVFASKPTSVLVSSAQDQALVASCLRGSEAAWSELIEKYKNLIYSIPLKNGFTPEDAADIFQSVCLTLLSELPRLREPQALAAWLIQVASHACWRHRKLSARGNGDELDQRAAGDAPKMPEELLLEVEREEILRQALAELPPRCGRLVELLFFSFPEISYDEVARELGAAKGSIGASRMRCLEKLHGLLKQKGFR